MLIRPIREGQGEEASLRVKFFVAKAANVVVGPIFCPRAAKGRGFPLSLDETEVWAVLHATSNGAGACDNMRYTMVQLFSNGAPNFGAPVAF